MHFVSSLCSSLSKTGSLLWANRRSPIAAGSAVALLGIANAPSAFAGPVTEAEANGTAANNTITTAQGVLFTDFTPNTNPNVFGNLPTATISGLNSISDVDFYSFQTGIGTGYFDIDSIPYTFDGELALFDSTGTVVAFADDNDLDPGSTDIRDPFLGTYTFTQAGTYYIAVDRFINRPNALNFATLGQSLTRPDGANGGFTYSNATTGDSSYRLNGAQVNGVAYTLHISLSNPTGVSAVPEPGEWATMGMAGAGLCGLMVRARRKKANQSATVAA